MSRRPLIDISRLGTDTTWPAVATEVNGYLQNWLAAANAQVSHRPQPHGHCHGSLRLASGGNPDATHPRR